MAKWCSFAVMLAVICLSVILSLEADAQSTIDETMTCGSTTLEEVVMEIRDVKKLLASNQKECDTATDPSKQALVSALVSNCIPLLIQQNVDGSNFFNRSWAEFKVGFNDSRGNYWLGNELLSQLTASGHYKLKLELQSRSNTNNWYSAEYSRFRVLPETYNYELLVAGFSGNAGRDALGYQNGMKFTTYDRDNDRWSGNCAVHRGSGFWYKDCAWCSVNGNGNNFYWSRLPGDSHYLQTSRMWLQCK